MASESQKSDKVPEKRNAALASATASTACTSSSLAAMNGSCKAPLADFKFPEKNENEDKDDENSDKFYVYNPTTMPIVSLRQGLAKKASPWALISWVKLALTLDGRDKITKVFQYSARMLAWWFAANAHQTKRFKSVQNSLTTSRKAFRLGRSFIEVQKIRDSGLLELFFNPTNNKSSDPAWKIVGNVMKMIGLMGFWAGDNVNFLTGSGLFDDYRKDDKEVLAQRNDLKTTAAFFANRFYFFGSIAGLVTSLRVYWSYRQTTIRDAHEKLVAASKRVTKAKSPTEETKNKELWKEAKATLDKAREKQFGLFLTVLKGCVDVMVFSNNPGIDLHQKLRGKKNHEGFHCLCGLISASTVLYNSYPDASK